MSTTTSFHHGLQRSAAIRSMLDRDGVDRHHRIRIAFSGDHAILEGEAEQFADKEAALSATIMLGGVTVVTDRVMVDPSEMVPTRTGRVHAHHGRTPPR